MPGDATVRPYRRRVRLFSRIRQVALMRTPSLHGSLDHAHESGVQAAFIQREHFDRFNHFAGLTSAPNLHTPWNVRNL